MNSEKQQKTAVITGGSSGIGLQIVLHLAAAGYKVVNVSRSAPPEQTPCEHIACDLSLAEQRQAAAERIASEYKTVDLVVNNAGLGISGAAELLPEEKIRYVTEVDYFAPFFFTRALLPTMPQKSKIVFISSACALFALPYRGVYCSAKAAVNMLSYSLRMELAASKIDVVCICPGDVKSNFTQNRLKYIDTNERYGQSVEKAQYKIDSREHKRMDEQKASKKISRIILRKKGALYIVGAKYKFLYFCGKILSQNFMLKMTKKLFL